MSDEYWNDPWGLNERWARTQAWYKAQHPDVPAPKSVPTGLLGIPEPPTWSESMGRGAMDLLQPIKQGWYNLTDAAQADSYRTQRAEEERLYATGLLGRPPKPGEDLPTDMWRMQGRVAAAAPLLVPGLAAATAPSMAAREVVLGEMGTWNLFDALNSLRKRMDWME